MFEKSMDFSLSCCERIDRYLMEHLQHLNINFYGYTKSYSNNKRFTLSSDPSFIKYYFETEHYKVDWVGFPKALDQYGKSMITWQYCDEEHLTCKLWQSHQKEKQIAVYLWLYSQYDNYCSAHYFGIYKRLPKIINQSYDRELTILINNIGLLKRFIYTFLCDNQDIIQEADKNLYHVQHLNEQAMEHEYDEYWGEYIHSVNDFKKLNYPERIYLTGNLDGIFLKREEAIMLFRFYSGKSYADIAKEFNLSVRTVEKRFSDIKNKLKAKSKLDLLNILSENEVIDIIKICL